MSRGEKVERLALSTNETGAALGISQRSVQRQVAAGKLPSIRVGHRVLIPLEALKDLIREQTEES